jgi:hypothetical protein
MRTPLTLCAIALALMTQTQARGGGPGDWETHRSHFFGRLRPVGGCNPDGRGLFHWWNPHCFPRSCGPDDYCRKPMPNVCRPVSPTTVGAYPQPQPTAPARPPTPAHSP